MEKAWCVDLPFFYYFIIIVPYYFIVLLLFCVSPFYGVNLNPWSWNLICDWLHWLLQYRYELLDFPIFSFDRNDRRWLSGWVEYLFGAGKCLQCKWFRAAGLTSIFCNRLWIEGNRRYGVLSECSLAPIADLPVQTHGTNSSSINHTSILLETYFIIWQPWSLFPFLFLIVIWFLVSAVRQPLKHLARTACLALLPNTEDGVWRWDGDPPVLVLAADRAWKGLSGLIWAGLEGSTMLAICVNRWIWVLDADSKKENKERTQVQKLEGCKLSR